MAIWFCADDKEPIKPWERLLRRAIGALSPKAVEHDEGSRGFYAASLWPQYFSCENRDGKTEILSFYSLPRNSNLNDFPREADASGHAEWVVQSTMPEEDLLMLRGRLSVSQAGFLEEKGARPVSLDAYVKKIPNAFGDVNPAPVGESASPYILLG